MSGQHATFYTLRTGWRQRRLAVAAIGLLALAGCGHISFPMGETAETKATALKTASIKGTETPESESEVVETDRGVIASTLASAPADKTAEASPSATQLAWVNPETGNQGTIFEIVDADPKGIHGCRKFSTTANTIEGVRAYSGIACPDSFDKWHVTVLKPADAGA